jgi:hypothetical protein
LTALIGFTGDLMCHAGFVVQEAEGTPFGDCFSPELIKLCQSHDELWGNLEGPVSPVSDAMAVWEKIRPMQRESPKLFFLERYLADIRRLGFRVLGVANNHAFDFETPDDTLVTAEILNRQGFAVPGCSFTPVVRQVNDITFAIFATTNFVNPPFVSGPVALLADDAVESLCVQITRWRREVDYVTVLTHWGWDYVQQPTAKVIELAARLIAAGARIIYGNHPHILWPIHQPANDRIIIYSLGNLSQVFGVGPRHPKYHLFRQALHSGILSLSITRERITPVFQRTFVSQTFEAWLADVPARKSFWFWDDADIRRWSVEKGQTPHRLRSVISPVGQPTSGELTRRDIARILGRTEES